MKPGTIAPSMMCADLAVMRETLAAFQRPSVQYLHIDIMDGEFVPNYALGTDFCVQLRRMSPIPLDLHLMIQRPDLKLDRFHIQPGENVSVHWESTPHIRRTLEAIRALGAKAMVALNPGTPISVLDYLLPSLDGVLLMTVDPGFAGQAMAPASLEKIQDTRRYLAQRGRPELDIQVDGNVSFENARLMRQAGADIFVAGTSSVFSSKGRMEDNLAALERIVEAEQTGGREHV